MKKLRALIAATVIATGLVHAAPAQAAPTGSSQAQLPQVHVPQVYIPEIHLPTIQVPAIHVPQVHIPHIQLPDLAQLLPAPAPAPQLAHVQAGHRQSVEDEFIRQINDYRVAHGLNPVAVDDFLTQQATGWSHGQARTNTLKHSEFNVWENVARNSHSNREFFIQWKESPSHNQTMLNPTVTRIGFGIAQAANGMWYGTMQML